MIAREDDAVSVGAGFLPNLPGAICDTCLPVVDALVVAEVRDEAASHMLRTADFEIPTDDAVQEYLSIHGWVPEVVTAGAVRLHMDGRRTDAFDLLDAATAAVPDRAGWFKVEAAALRTLDGDVGRALDLLEATTPRDHPCWHLHHGLLAHGLGRRDAALEHWYAQVEQSAEEPLGWRILGWALIQSDAPADEMAELMNQAIGRFPDVMEFRAWLGLSHFKAGDRAAALRELELSRTLRPLDEAFGHEVDELIARLRGSAGGEA